MAKVKKLVNSFSAGSGGAYFEALCMESGHLEVAFINIGQVLIYAPADENDFWINRTVAVALNDRDDYARHMRYEFITGTYCKGYQSIKQQSTLYLQ